MKLTDYIKKLIMNYFVIFSIIVISITVLRQIFIPNEYFKLRDIYIYMICALAGDLPSLIFYSPKEMAEGELRIRILIHFALLEAVLLVLANAMGWVAGTLNTIMLSIQIAFIYMVVRFILWLDDRKAANSINEKLKAMKAETVGVSEEE